MVVEACDAAETEIAGVGFGMPGVIDRRQGVISAAPNLPLAGVRFQALMSERLGLPVAVDNDANCAMLAEWRHGAARGATDALLLTLGTGIGGGIVCNGGIVRGASGGAAEIGHMVLDLEGPPCSRRLPRLRALRVVRVRRRDRPRGPARGDREAGLGARPRGGGGARGDRRARHRARARRRRAGARGARRAGPPARARPGGACQRVQPRGDRHRRRRDRGRRSAPRSRARGRRDAGAARGCATSCASSSRAFGAEAGMLGAATLAFEELVR